MCWRRCQYLRWLLFCCTDIRWCITIWKNWTNGAQPNRLDDCTLALSEWSRKSAPKGTERKNRDWGESEAERARGREGGGALLVITLMVTVSRCVHMYAWECLLANACVRVCRDMLRDNEEDEPSEIVCTVFGCVCMLSGPHPLPPHNLSDFSVSSCARCCFSNMIAMRLF